jgi:hypothetical protein
MLSKSRGSSVGTATTTEGGGAVEIESQKGQELLFSMSSPPILAPKQPSLSRYNSLAD